MAAFLFTWPDGDKSKRPVKLPKVGGPGLAVLDKPESGPQFGPDGLRVPLSENAPQQVCTRSQLTASDYAGLNQVHPGKSIDRTVIDLCA